MKVFSLSGPPPKLYKGRVSRSRPVAPIFQPYKEALPLESDYYSFVIDDNARFRVERGNTRSHAGMVGGIYVGAAGHFWITRSGKLGMVFCTSNDFWLYVPNERDPTVGFVIDAFQRHQAFDLSIHSYFKFSKSLTESFSVDQDGTTVLDEMERRRLLEAEGQGVSTGSKFSDFQIN